jgi:WD40 repeat protein
MLHASLYLAVLNRDKAKNIGRNPRFTINESRDPVSAIAFSADGKTVATGALGSVTLWDVAKAKEIQWLNGFEGAIRGLALAPGADEWAVIDERNLTRVPKAKAVKVEKRSRPLSAPMGVAVSPDGKATIVVGSGHSPEIWEQGEERWPRSLSGQKSGRTGGGCVAVSPDGAWVAVGSESTGEPYADDDGLVTIWDLKNRKLLRQFGGRPRDAKCRINAVAFTADSRWLGYADGREIVLSSVARGEEVARFLRTDNDIVAMCISPDGRILASAGHDKTVRLCEVSTASEIRILDGHRQEVTALAFSPDGKRLASGSADTSCVVWDVYGAAESWRPLKPTLNEKELEGFWKDLSETSAPGAYHAITALARVPKQSIPFLKEKLGDYQPPDAKRIDQLLKDLQNEIPPECDQAYQELLEIGDTPEKPLRQALKQAPSDVLRKRLEKLLENNETGTPVLLPGKRLQVLRAMAVLELLATDDAKAILQSLAKGNPKDPVMREAKAVLSRLAK